MITLILLILLTLVLAAFFSGTEIAFITANKLGVEIERDKGTRRSKLISGFYEKPKEFLSSILVGNNIVLVVFTYTMTRLIEPVLFSWIDSEALRLIIIAIIATIVMLLFGEFLPKIIFNILVTICPLFNHALLMIN